MKTILLTIVALFAFAVGAAAQTDGALEQSMRDFISAIETKNTARFLGFVSPAKGLTVMNTIDQGEAGNADKPMLDSKLAHKKLAADFKKKGELYQSIFAPSPDSPNFYDAFANRRGKWTLNAENKFTLNDETSEMPTQALYARWEKIGKRWYVVEVGRPIS